MNHQFKTLKKKLHNSVQDTEQDFIPGIYDPIITGKSCPSKILSSKKSKPYAKQFNYFCETEIFKFCRGKGDI